MTAIRVPLHISRDDTSPEANARRLALHLALFDRNPKGWRRRRTGRHKKRPAPTTHITSMVTLANLHRPSPIRAQIEGLLAKPEPAEVAA